MHKLIKPSELLDLVNDGDTIMVGGFLNVGGPNKIIMYLLENKDLKDLTIIANDTGMEQKPGISQIVIRKCAGKVVASHIGTCRETGRQMSAGELDVELVPQGTLTERIRAAGYGLGGVLTPTGVGIEEIEAGKQKFEFDGKTYLYEAPLKADVALLNAHTVDMMGNMRFKGSSRVHSTAMAFAADKVIVEADNLLTDSYVGPDSVHIPGLLITHIIDGSKLDENGKEID
ncbi:MAG: 3-oxoacid CoA-transferase subunit A [Tissierellia bacterium]|nr:3-oxoacid CoA-transferase subunit A [Tissierellia bacterium]